SAPTTCCTDSRRSARTTAARSRRTSPPPSSTSSSASRCRRWSSGCRRRSPSSAERVPLMANMIEIKNISKWYGSFQVLTDCTTAVSKGEVVVVCGPSGSGKSTLIKCVNGLEPFQKGDIIVDAISVGDPRTNLSKLRSRIGMVFQNFELFPHMTVAQNLTLAQVKVLGRSQAEARDKGLKLLDRVGLIAQKDKFPGQLSGGQQQRVAIARALSMDP